MKDPLKAANDRLKGANIKIKIDVKDKGRGTLTLRGMFPPKPGDTSRTAPYSQRIAPGLPLTPAGIKQAEKLAHKIASDLALNLFRWEDYQKPKTESKELLDAIDRFHHDFLDRGGTAQNWKNRYTPTLSKLQALSSEDMRRVVLLTPSDTRNREIYHDVIRKFAKFAGVSVDLDGLRGNYIPEERTIPTDEEIERYFSVMPSPFWQWVYGMIASYGLRPHEVFRLKSLNFPEITIGEKTKTGSRLAFPLPDHWLRVFELEIQKLSPIKLDRDNKALSNEVGRVFRRAKIPFKPYDLRHAYAIRAIGLNVPVVSAARWMGHSLETHNRHYHRWMNAQNDRNIYAQISEGQSGKMP